MATKGIMLASRPSAPPVKIQPKKKSFSGKPFIPNGNAKEFISSKVENSGLAIAAENRVLREKAQGPTATSKHKQWLLELQQLKEQAMEEAREYNRAQAEEKEKFAERSSALRQLLREGKWDESHVHCNTTKVSSLEKHLNSPTKKLEAAVTNTQEETRAKSDVKSSPPKKNTANLESRPGWALTKNQHEEVKEGQEEDLLDFALNLDFDKYLEDMEIKDAVEFVKKRVKEIEVKQKDIEEEESMREQAVENAAKSEELAKKAVERAERIEEAEANELVSNVELRTESNVLLNSPALASPSGQSGGQTHIMSMRDLQTGLVMSQKSIKKVHSKNSVRAMIEERAKAIKDRTKLRVEQRYDDSNAEETPETTKIKIKKQVKASIEPSIEGTRTVQKLPYLYRHPAV